MKRIFSLILTVVISFGIFVPTVAEDSLTYEQKANAFETSVQLINFYSVTEAQITDTLKKALMKLGEEDDVAYHKMMNALAQTVDEFSYYYSKEEYEALSKEMSGVICGIGVSAMVVNGYFEVVSLIDGGAAKEAGIMPGDRIIEADGVDITGLKANVATNYITGEEGTQVTVKVLKTDKSIVTYTLERRVIVVPSVESEILEDSGIGYLIINSFTENTPVEVDTVLYDFREQGVKNLIVDLRNNGGGVMDSGILTAELFMEKGETIITTKGKNEMFGEEKYIAELDGYDFNTVILLNEYTASASEIMASAVIENGHAVAVGKATYGKACAQGVYPVATGGALRVTILNYFTAKGNNISKSGIIPAYEIENRKYRVSKEDAPKLSYSVKYSEGAQGEEVKAIETMLYELGTLTKEPDDVYDEYTKNAVSVFQSAVGLFPYGVCDLTTQSYLVSKYLETDFYSDDQFDFAVDYLKDKK